MTSPVSPSPTKRIGLGIALLAGLGVVVFLAKRSLSEDVPIPPPVGPRSSQLQLQEPPRQLATSRQLTVWWDGFAIPKNFDGDPEIAFQVLMEGLKESVVQANNNTAIWTRSVYKPGRFATGTADSARAGAPPYPMVPQASLVHEAIGAHIGEYLAGSATAEKVLAEATTDYIAAAKARGLLK